MKLITLYLVLFLLFSSFSCTNNKSKIDWTPVPDSIKNKSGQNNNSNSNSSQLQKAIDELNFTTGDNKNISGSFIYINNKKSEPQPLVILIHQFTQNREQWKADFTDSLLTLGYKVLAYDIRGHGKSDKQNGKLEDILTDPEQAPLDIKAVIEWTKKQSGIDTSRIAAIGTSIGGNIALYAGLNSGLKVPISVSNGKSTFEAFTGYNEMMMGRPFFPKMKNVLLICGSKDGDHEAGQKWIYDNFCENPKDMKVYDSDKHGMFLIDEHPEINSIILNWLKKYL